MISPALVEEIRQKADIVQVISRYIMVIKKGNAYVAICPFHDDKNPSMQISRAKQIYKCFVCGAGGNVFNFVENYEKISYFDAVRRVAEIIGFEDPSLEKPVRKVDDKTANALKALKASTELYQYLLKTEDGKVCADYLKNRNISKEMQEYFSLGYSSSNPELSIKILRGKGIDIQALDDAGIIARRNGSFIDKFSGRLIFPIYNEYSEVIGYSARRIVDDGSEKYRNSQNTILFNKSKVLYNYQNAKDEAKKEGYVYVTEGFMDVFALYAVGIKSCVALMGTAFTPNHAKMLRKLNVEIRLCLDGDEAGQSHMIKCAEILDKEGLPYKIVDYGECVLDPDEVLQQFGGEILKKLVNRVIDKNQFIYNYYLKKADLSTFEGKKKFAETLIPFVSQLSNPIDFEMMIKNISFKTGIEVKTLIQLAGKEKTFTKVDYNTLYEDVRPTYQPTNIRRLQRVQNAILYQILSNMDASEQMENKGGYFLNSMYAKIYNYIVDGLATNPNFTVGELISELSQNDDPASKKLVDEITSVAYDENQPPYDKVTMDQYLDTLNEEIKKKQKKDYLINAIKDKTPEEAALAAQNYFNSLKGEN